MADEPRLTKRQLKKLLKEQAAVVKQDPNNLVARLKLAGALKELGKDQEAVEHYRSVASAYRETGKLVQAISVYKGILEMAPGDSETESALTELSARRAEEIKRKSMPRLQQVDGRWVMPAESDVSEEVGTDPGQEPARGLPPTPSVLRLPAQALGEVSTSRRTRRSRPRLPGVEGLEGAEPPELQEVDDEEEDSGTPSWSASVAAPAPGPLPPLAGAPDSEMAAQTSLPSLFQAGSGAPVRAVPAASQPPASPRADVPPPVPAPPPVPVVAPPSTPAQRGAPPPGPFGAPPPPAVAMAPSKAGSEVVLTAEEPQEFRDENRLLTEDEAPVEEPTSPGPGSYDETIRKSAVRLDRGVTVPSQGQGRDVQPRRTLVGVPLPAHPDFTATARDPEVHRRPTPAVPLPAVLRPEAPSEEEVTATRDLAPPAEEQGTRSLRRTSPPEVEAAPAPPRPVAAPEEPPSDTTLGAVFDEDEEAFWAELSGGDEPAEEPPPPKTSPAAATRALKPADVSSPAADRDRRPRATMPMPAMTPPPQAAVQPVAKISPTKPAKVASPSPTPPASAAADAPAAKAAAPAAETPAEEEVQLEEVQLFRDLSETSRELLRSRLVTRREKAGTVVVREGDPGNALFVVTAGRVSVSKTGRDGQKMVLATLGPGAFFGEFALLSDRKRHATVTVAQDAVFYEISRKVIADLTKSEPAFGNTLRAFYRRRLLNTLLSSAPFFGPLTEEERESLMGRLRFRRIAEGVKIITEGEPGGGFFLILIGQVQVTKIEPDGSTRVLARLGDGTYFGEMSLLKGGNAVATVTTETPTEIVQLAAAEFYRILSNYPQIWEEVNQEAKRRELANLQILSGRSLPSSGGDDGVVM